MTIAACGSTAPPVASAAPARLEVEVRNLASDEGLVGFALFDSATAFASGSEPLQRAFLEIHGATCVWVVEQLPPGDYAVKVFHDRNGNRRLDHHLLGMPTEPYGFSNDARSRFGPPRFEKARFRLQAGRRIVVTVE